MRAARKPASAPPAEVMNLEQYTPALLTFITNRLTNSASALYRRRFGVGVLEFRVMAMLTIEPGASGARIAAVIGLDKAAVSRTLRTLDKRGFARVAAGKGRAQILTLTPEGRAVYEQVWTLARRREEALLAGFSAAEREVLRDFLRRLLAATPLVAAVS